MAMKNQILDTMAYGLKLSHSKTKLSFLLKPYVLSILAGGLLLLLTNVITVSLPIMINGGVTLIESGRPFIFALINTEIKSVFTIICLVILLALLGAIIRTLSRMVIFDIGRTIERDLRAKLFFHLTVLDEKFFKDHSVGDLMNHLTNDMSNVRMVTGFAALNILNIFFVFCFTVPLLLRIDTILAACALLPFPLVMIATSGLAKKMYQATRRYQEELSHLVTHVQENLLGAHVIRLFHQQTREGQRFFQTNHDTTQAGLRLARIRMFMQPVMRLMIGIAVGLVLYVGGNAVLAKKISLGDFVEVNARILQLAWPAMSVGFIMSVFSRCQASLARINLLLKYVPSIHDGKKVIGKIEKIQVQNLLLRDDKKTAKPLSFSLSKNHLMGIVGHSGSGKTTLLKALCHRIPVPPNTIYFNGHDVNSIELASLYNQISVVTEEPYLFHQSIADNIKFMRPEASHDELLTVIKICRLDKDLQGFSKGLDTIVGERGITLSGGQRQRVALARALLAKRSVLILDDALSSVDADTERHIVSNLFDYLKDSIVIIATHRLSAIKKAEPILVLANGELLESGDHETLSKQGKFYPKLWGLSQIEGKLS